MQRLPESASSHPVVAPSARNGGAMPATYTEVPATAGFNDPGPDTESGSLLEYWGILRRRKGTLILISCLGTLAGFLVTLPQTPIYQVRTSMEIVGLNQNFLNVKQSDPLDEGGNSSDEVDIQTQVKILQSESLIDQVLGKLRAGALPQAPPAAKAAAWRKWLNLPALGTADASDDALTYARKHLNVRSVGQTRIIELTADSPSPETAVTFANTLANEFIDENIESRWKTTQRTGEWLSRQIDDLRVRLERSEDKLQAYARDNGLVYTEDDKTNISEEKLRQLQEALSAAQTDRITKESRAEMAKTSSPEALPDVLNDPTLRDYQTKITELNRQLAELRVPYTAEHPKVKSVQMQLAAMQAAFDRERTDILKRIDNEYQEAVRREKLLDDEYAAQRSVVTGEGEKAVQYNILKREVDSNRQLYDALLQQLKQSTLASALRASNIRVVDPAKLPKRPYKPDVPVSSSLGLLGGFFVGAALIIMQERANRTIQAPGETPAYLNIPELGIIPADTGASLVRIRFAANAKSPERLEDGSILPAVRRSAEMVTWRRKASMVAEAFRATLVSIMFSAERDERPKVLVITSASPSEGKSTVVSNLGVAIAEVNQRVLLIDADLRKPRMHDIFKLSNERGLSDLLRTKDFSAAPIESFIQETAVPELFVMTSGSTTSAATSLLYSSRLPEVVKELRKHFETIIIDTPPMLQIPDARVLGRMADRVILVVRAGKTTRDAAVAARQRFFEDGTPLLGTMLNYWNPKRSPNGYYGYANNYYSNYKSYRTQTAGD